MWPDGAYAYICQGGLFIRKIGWGGHVKLIALFTYHINKSYNEVSYYT